MFAFLRRTGSGGLAALGLTLALAARAAATENLTGRYTVASLPAREGATLADATYGGVMDIAAYRHAYAVTWRLLSQTHRLRGLGLADGDDLLGVSLATGGAAHGVAIYRHVPGEHCWRGTWITSLDSGDNPGRISFDDGGAAALPGRHALHCQRPGSGGFDGTVTITAAGPDYLLAFGVDGALLYRGAGILLDDGRLVVGWSFGSAPAVAVYRADHDGLFTGRRLSLRGGGSTVVSEDLARSGDDAARLLPAAARVDPNLAPPDVDAGLEPDAPEVKNWVYEDLVGRYGSDGWAQRWLEGQLTTEEYALLEQAVHRRRGGRGGRDKAASARATIGDLIEQERRRGDD